MNLTKCDLRALGICLCLLLNLPVNKSHLKLTFDVVTVAEAAKLLLASSVPDIEFDRAAVGVEHKRVHLDAKGS